MALCSTQRSAHNWLIQCLILMGIFGMAAFAPPALADLPPLTGVAQVSASKTHTCAVTMAGAVLCWGKNDYGQLGDGTRQRRILPTQVTGLESGVMAVTAGNSHSCALTTVGAVLCWGRNRLGQLGDNTTTDRIVPTPVFSLGSGVQAISVGDESVVAYFAGGAIPSVNLAAAAATAAHLAVFRA